MICAESFPSQPFLVLVALTIHTGRRKYNITLDSGENVSLDLMDEDGVTQLFVLDDEDKRNALQGLKDALDTPVDRVNLQRAVSTWESTPWLKDNQVVISNVSAQWCDDALATYTEAKSRLDARPPVAAAKVVGNSAQQAVVEVSREPQEEAGGMDAGMDAGDLLPGSLNSDLSPVARSGN